MMKTKLLATVCAGAFLGACAEKNPPPLVSTPEIQYKTSKVVAAISVIPDWYKELPSDDEAIFTTGSATAPDLQFAVDVATQALVGVTNNHVVIRDASYTSQRNPSGLIENE